MSGRPISALSRPFSSLSRPISALSTQRKKNKKSLSIKLNELMFEDLTQLRNQIVQTCVGARPPSRSGIAGQVDFPQSSVSQKISSMDLY